MVNQRTESTKKRLEMYKQRPKRDKKGRIIYQEYKSKDTSHEARIQPDRRWFGPTRTVPQHELQSFREEMDKAQKDPNQYLMKPAKIPFSLLKDNQKVRGLRSAAVFPNNFPSGPLFNF
jgi:nuclear GTP-binding protein